MKTDRRTFVKAAVTTAALVAAPASALPRRPDHWPWPGGGTVPVRYYDLVYPGSMPGKHGLPMVRIGGLYVQWCYFGPGDPPNGPCASPVRPMTWQKQLDELVQNAADAGFERDRYKLGVVTLKTPAADYYGLILAPELGEVSLRSTNARRTPAGWYFWPVPFDYTRTAIAEAYMIKAWNMPYPSLT